MAGRILTLTEAHGITTPEELRAWLRSMRPVAMAMAAQGLTDVPAVALDADAAPAVARVNHGQWLADCPSPACGGAMLLLRGAPYMCGTCLNAEAGFKWRPVSWPSDAETIEATLLEQPMLTLRNWEPGIGVEMLRSVVDSELRGEPPVRIRELL